jgi:hypothetical protein
MTLCNMKAGAMCSAQMKQSNEIFRNQLCFILQLDRGLSARAIGR